MPAWGARSRSSQRNCEAAWVAGSSGSGMAPSPQEAPWRSNSRRRPAEMAAPSEPPRFVKYRNGVLAAHSWPMKISGAYGARQRSIDAARNCAGATRCSRRSPAGAVAHLVVVLDAGHERPRRQGVPDPSRAGGRPRGRRAGRDTSSRAQAPRRGLRGRRDSAAKYVLRVPVSATRTSWWKSSAQRASKPEAAVRGRPREAGAVALVLGDHEPAPRVDEGGQVGEQRVRRSRRGWHAWRPGGGRRTGIRPSNTLRSRGGSPGPAGRPAPRRRSRGPTACRRPSGNSAPRTPPRGSPPGPGGCTRRRGSRRGRARARRPPARAGRRAGRSIAPARRGPRRRTPSCAPRRSRPPASARGRRRPGPRSGPGRRSRRGRCPAGVRVPMCSS